MRYSSGGKEGKIGTLNNNNNKFFDPENRTL